MDNEITRAINEMFSRNNFKYLEILYTYKEDLSCDEGFISDIYKEVKSNPSPSEARLQQLFVKHEITWPENSGLSDLELDLSVRDKISLDIHMASFMARNEYKHHEKANKMSTLAESIRLGKNDNEDEWNKKVDFSIFDEMPEVIPTGFNNIDKAFNGGIRTSTYNIITAESNIGKTTILVNLALNYLKSGKKVLFLTFEETEQAIAGRFAQNILGIDMFSLNKMNEYQKNKGAKTLENLRIVSKPSGTLKIEEFLSIEILKQYDVLILDYYVHFKLNSKNDTHEEIGHISKSLMTYSKEFNKQIWTAAQANREGYGKKEMSMSNIGKSLESVQVADTVIGVKFSEDVNEEHYSIEMKILKDRQGANRKQILEFLIHKPFQRMIEANLEPKAIQINDKKQPNKKTKAILDIE